MGDPPDRGSFHFEFMMPDKFSFIRLQDSPSIVVTSLPGVWLLERTTPSWRIEDPIEGFQRIVSEERARNIAAAVLDQRRTFPNAIVLATDKKKPKLEGKSITFPDSTKFLVVDGQHRLWAQHFSAFECDYCCLVHFGLNEREMATLFVEINDNQKRVPSSLRWDLVRLVRPEDDPHTLRAADLTYDLATTRSSSLFQRIDLTGENSAISLKQGSVAPAIKAAIKSTALRDEGYDLQLRTVRTYLAAIRECDADDWDDSVSPLYGARVFRAVVRLMPDILAEIDQPLAKVRAGDFYEFLKKIDLDSLDADKIKAQQGSAGIKAIYDTVKAQVLGD